MVKLFFASFLSRWTEQTFQKLMTSFLHSWRQVKIEGAVLYKNAIQLPVKPFLAEPGERGSFARCCLVSSARSPLAHLSPAITLSHKERREERADKSL